MTSGSDIATVADVVRRRARERPDAPALDCAGRALTFAELDHRSSQVAQALLASGVEAGSRVAYLGKNGLEWFEVTFGAAKLGAIGVPLSWRLAPREVVAILADCGAEVLVVDADLADTAALAEAELPALGTIVVVGHADGWPSYDAWRDAGAPQDPGHVADPASVAFLLYTSGTTGVPKGAMLTHDNLFAGLLANTLPWGIDGDAVSLAVMPLFHIAGAGWAIVSLAHGARTVVLREADPALVVSSIERFGVTHLVLVPAVIQMVLALADVRAADLSSLSLLLYGASPIADTVLVEALDVFGCDLVQVYGLTETTGAVTQLDAADHDPTGRPELLRSCGRPCPGVEVRIVDGTTGRDVEGGAVGELWIRSTQVMRGYWEAPEATAEALPGGGWFRTGDAGFRDDAGYLFLHDRVKDMIVTGGENVYPAEVENALLRHPDVADAAVFGVPDPHWGEAVKAVVVPRGEQPIDTAELLASTRAHLAGFKLPKSVDVVAELPRNATGKVLKRVLRDPYWVGTERRIG